MVRSIEPDPPEAFRRVDQKVKQSDATPDKLAHQRVADQERRKGQERRDPGHPVDADSVTLNTQPEGEPPARSTPPPQSPRIDVEG